MKRFVAMLLMLAALCGGAICFAAAGGASDPLVSMSYLMDTVKAAIMKNVQTQTDKKIGGLISGYEKRLEGAAKFDTGSYEQSGKFIPVSISEGASLELGEFGCFMPLYGSTLITVESGEIVDITTGSAVKNRTMLAAYHKYFATEGAKASIRAYGSVSGMVDGRYRLGEAEPIAAGETFCDMFDHWAADYVYELYSRGIVNGVETHVFAPNSTVTRGMLVTILGRVYGASTAQYSQSGFADVSMSAWYGPYVAWAKEAGLVDGYDDGSFRPEANITREQMALIFTRFAAYVNASLPEAAPQQFADSAKISAWAAPAVEYAQKTGLINGKNGNIFDPQGTATRAEICAVTSRFMEKAGI